MARFEKLQEPIYVSAFRPGIDPAPPWAPSKMPKMDDGDWLVMEGDKVSAVAKADMMAQYRHDK